MTDYIKLKIGRQCCRRRTKDKKMKPWGDMQQAAAGKQQAMLIALRMQPPQKRQRKQGGGAAEQEKAALIAVLDAHGIIKDMRSELQCPSCAGPLQKEATYSCRKCQSLLHVRCLPQEAPEGAYLTLCFVCHERTQLIVDVMGVCQADD